MIMNKNERPSFLRGRGAAVGLVICFVAVIAIAGAYTFNNYKKQMNEQVAKAEDQAEELTEDKSKEAATDDIVHLKMMIRRKTALRKSRQRLHKKLRRRMARQEGRLQRPEPRRTYGSARTVHSPGRQAVRS